MFKMSVKLTIPPLSFFSSLRNATVALPPASSTTPFPIPESLYLSLLDVRVPFTIATLYAVTVHILNAHASTAEPPAPYRIATTRAFKAFVILHNLFLAIYSGWTFVGILDTVRRTIPGITGSAGFAGTVHGLCKIGAAEGSGLWQEGLAFYGWLFYVSKFYEVL